RRRHTRSDRDWSSDVCSSDLFDQAEERAQAEAERPPRARGLHHGDAALVGPLIERRWLEAEHRRRLADVQETLGLAVERRRTPWAAHCRPPRGRPPGRRGRAGAGYL